MNETPILLNYGRLEGLCPGKDSSDLALHCGLCLGELAEKIYHADQLEDLHEKIRQLAGRARERPSLDAVWRAALARELLLLPPAHLMHDLLDDLLQDCRPFGEQGPSYCDLRARRFSAALFPIDTGDEHIPAGVGQIWMCTEGTRLPSTLEAFARQPDCCVWSTPYPDASIHGASWQLAAELARKALAAHPAKDLILRTAGRWIASGRLREDSSVELVEWGNKFQLAALSPLRRWLLPYSMRESGRSPSIHWVETTAQAWRIVSAVGITDEGEASWPANVSTLHSFVSDQLSTLLLLSLLLGTRGLRRIVLWHTNNEEISWQPARQLQKILPHTIAGLEKVELRLVSGNMPEVQSQMKPHLEQDLESAAKEGTNVFFNITNGTLPLRYAILHLAARKPELSLVYGDRRPPDSTPGEAEFSLLTFPNGEPSVQLLKYYDNELPEWKFDDLHKHEKGEGFDELFLQKRRVRRVGV